MGFSQTSQYQVVEQKCDACTYMKHSSLDWIWVLLKVGKNDRTINKLMGEINKKTQKTSCSKENQEPKHSNYSDILLKKLWEQHVENQNKIF